MADYMRLATARPAFTLPASRCRAFRLSSPATTSTSPGDSPRSMADVQDLYIEKLDGKGNYEGNDGAMASAHASITRSFTCAAAKMLLSMSSPPRTARC